MMRALYTAATGMIAQQSNVDNISNNLSNVNTVGYKQEKMEFKSLHPPRSGKGRTGSAPPDNPDAYNQCKWRGKADLCTGRTWYQSGIQHLYLYTGVTDGK